MNFGAPHPYPYEMYLMMGQKYYLSPTREIDPYLDLTLSGMAYGYLAPLSWTNEPEYPERRKPVVDEITSGASQSAWTDPVGELFKEKRMFQERLLEDIVWMIRDREQLKMDHLARIDKESCEAKTRTFQVDLWQPAMNRQADRIRANAEKEMSGLEREKRMEEIACWRDVSRLRMEMHNVLREWTVEKRKESFFLDGK